MNEAKTVEAKPEHLEEYGCGPVQFSGQIDALFERHLRFDDVVDPVVAGARQKFEAAAHAVRDVLSQRWIETQQTYDRENPKRIYYLSMEFLIGRSLTNKVTNLTLHPFVERADRDGALDWFGLVEQEPDAGLGNGGLGRLAACFLDSMATMQLPAMGYGLRYEYGMFRQSIENGWQREHPDNWLRRRDPWEVVRSGRSCRGQAWLHVRDAPGKLYRLRQTVHSILDRNSLRPSRRGFRRQDRQQPATVECGRA